LCLECFSKVPASSTYHQNNETEQALIGRFHFEWAYHWLAITKESGVISLIHQLKYEGKKEIGLFLGKMIGQVLIQKGISDAVLLPVPITEKKKAKRGYNQAEIIAQGISQVVDLPIIADAVVKTRDTESQTKLTRVERQVNLVQVFQVKKAELLSHKTIIIVDDILTTGATIEALVIGLLELKNIKIIVLVGGKAVQK
jgi:ComF family protein